MKPVLASVSFPSEREVEVLLHNRWTVHEVEDIRQLLKDIGLKNINRITVDGSDLKEVDLSAAWMMVEFGRLLASRNVEINRRGIKEEHQRIFSIIRSLETIPSERQPYFGSVRDLFVHIGKASLIAAQSLVDLQMFFGRFCITVLGTIKNPARLRFRSVVYHINEIGLRAIPIVSLLAFLISIVLGYQGAVQLNRFGANIFTINLVSISLLREMAVIITAIIVAGRSGSAFAAKIGVMKINQEIDALSTFGLDPFDLLIMPRILGILIALPALTLIADFVGLVGTMFICSQMLHISPAEFLSRLHESVSLSTFAIGLVKAPFFALLIGITGCQQGLEVKSSSEEVGMRTTTAVVQSIFLIILADAAFSILFTWMGI